MPHTTLGTPGRTAAPELRVPTIAVVGLGPRGASLVERIGAHAQHDGTEVELLLIDDQQAGAGRIWRTDQTRELCMNTLADAVTLFTEPGATVTGPIIEGPTLYEWCLIARETAAGPSARLIPAARAATVAAYPPRAGLASDYAEELSSLRPESHPSRALYGEYLSWFFDRAVAELPETVRVTRFTARAVAAEGQDPESGGERLLLSTGERIVADAVVLATGWLDREPSRAEQALERALVERGATDPELTWVRQGSPVEQDLSAIRPGEAVIVRGLGMGFFDTMALSTLGRGGRFVADPDAAGGLRYEASGAEPVLHVTSRRGVPFRAKSRYGGLPPRATQRLLTGVDWGREPRPINFDRALWPRIVGDAFLAHAETLARVSPGALQARGAELESAVLTAIAPIISGEASTDLDDTVTAVSEAVAPFIPDPQDRFDLAGEIRPAEGHYADPAAFDRYVRDRVAADLSEVDRGIDSPLKAGLWSISSARGVAAHLDSLAGFDAESRGSGAELLTALGGMVGSGPPAFRNNQLLALVAAGIVHFIGPNASVEVGKDGFVARSTAVAGSEVRARALIDAWMHFHDARVSADPLTRALLDAGRARPFTVRGRDGVAHLTGGIDVDPETGRIVGVDGSADPAIHIAGIPLEETLRGTVISPLPGTDAIFIRESDRVASSALRVARSADPHRELHPETPERDAADERQRDYEGALHV